MILKYLLVIAIIAAVYFFFIKKKPKNVAKKSGAKKEEKASDMVECATCKTFISVDEAIISGSKYYCSDECLKG